MHPADKYIISQLEQRQHAGNLRILKVQPNNLTDFSSNDYLGFARSEKLKQLINAEIENHPAKKIGSTGSRLLTGNSKYAEDLEQKIAMYHGHEAGLLFNSGYDANLGLLSSLPQRGDTVLADELIHASIIDGIRLSNANRYTFRHNNLQNLEEKLRHSKGNIYVVIESVYSMDGDTPDIANVLDICKRYNANLIVDEAHAIGVFGKGIIDSLGLQDRVFARVITYGKAMGVHGSIVLGSEILRNYLINFARSFIYTTAAPFHQLAAIKMAYQMLGEATKEIDQLTTNISLFNGLINSDTLIAENNSAIHCIKAESNETARIWSDKLKEAGTDIRAVLSPTVAQGSERLRICLHSFNTYAEIRLLANFINTTS